MKLLSPSELRDTKAQDTAREILRTKEINKASDEARKKLANAEADFAHMLEGQRARWLKEESDHSKDVAERQAELRVLEARRQKALEPIEILEKKVQDTLQEAQIALQSVLKREDDATDLYERLQTALDAVGAREVDVLSREHKAEVREQNILVQETVTKKNSEQIIQSFKEFDAYKKQTEKELDKLRTALTLQERSLDARADKLQRTEDKLATWSEQLKDERDTLERAFSRIRNQEKKKKV